MKKQETVFEALKDIYHHLKEWSDPSSALKKGNLLPLAIVIFYNYFLYKSILPF